jgi:hypothetical protein
MQVRFLEVTPSSVPEFSFMPGQVINLAGMTPEVRKWLREGRAELVRETPMETATVEPEELATVGGSLRKGPR